MMRLLGTLHSRLMLWIGMGWVVLIVSTLAFAYLSGSELIRQANISHLTYEANLIAQQVERSIEQRVIALERLADQVSEDLPTQSSQSVIRHEPMLALFDRLALVSDEGRIIASYPRLESLHNLDVSDRDYYRDVRALGEPYVGEPIKSRVNGRPLVVVSVPITNAEGDYAGQVVGTVSVESSSFFDSLRRIRIGDDGFASLFSAEGTVLSHPDRSRVMTTIGTGVNDDAVSLALLGWEGADEGIMAGGEPALEAFVQVWNAGWIVSVTLPMSQVQAPIGLLVRKLWWVGLVTFLLMLPFLWWLLRVVLGSLHRLERQIGQVAGGQRTRVQLSTRMRELRQLGATFNRLEQQREEVTARLHKRQAFLDAVLASSPVGMFVATPEGEMQYVNPALVKLVGHEGAAGQAVQWAEYIHPEDRQDFLELWREAMKSGRAFLRQIRCTHADGSLLWLEVHAGQVIHQQEVLGHVGTVKDITQRREQEVIQRWEAEHDPLTSLLNRRGFERRLEEAFAEWQQTRQQSVLMLFDLDHFKPINDEGGHALGDDMLRAIADAITPLVRRNDCVARQGGDEFAILMPSCTLSQAREVTRQLLETVAALEVFAAGKGYRVTLSLGAACFLEADLGIEEVIARADAASYQAKREGRNRAIEFAEPA
ncbi:diguanylate cyclase [Halomonas sp. YLGW01]|uniref:sensor domain-containing diguanylate cyclase n=1 Tax=Halomonas sp. YLGW01 TaxID=2773308 RepID=UPI00177ECE0A|nr:diguanylate cyclase [Halomonas sp. YLGW01]